MDISTPSEGSILIEDRALDSYHNILFSLTLFYARFHQWPASISLISHAFKQPRLVDGHCVALEVAVDFIGIDPQGMMAPSGDAVVGVGQAVDEWAADPHGRGESLAGKRKRRNPWGVWQGVFEKGEKDAGGLETSGEGEDEVLVYDAKKPWSRVL